MSVKKLHSKPNKDSLANWQIEKIALLSYKMYNKDYSEIHYVTVATYCRNKYTCVSYFI